MNAVVLHVRGALTLIAVLLLAGCGETRVRVDTDAGMAACTPSCDGLECGDDGCGGDCGSCPTAAPICTNGVCNAACTPDCTGRECGDDGCGGSCGACPMAAPMCVANVCQAQCTGDCTGRECGDDGCGRSCGTCAANDTCTAAGMCMGAPGCMAGASQCLDTMAYQRCGLETSSTQTRSFGPRIVCGEGRSCSSGTCRGGCVRPEIMLVVDRSQSMIGQAWIDVRQTVDEFVHAQQVSMKLGVRMFPTGPGCTAGAIHAPAHDNADFITMNLDTPTGDDETPLAAALVGLAGSFGSADDGQIVVLITDGVESCAADRTLAEREAEVLLRAGVRTFVVAFGVSSDAASLAAIAAAGGTTRHQVVTDAFGLGNVLANLLTDLDACGPPPGSGVIGDACTAAIDCAGARCLTDGTGFGRPFPNGYCSADCSVMACPAGSSCVPDAFSSIETCMKTCASGMDCRVGYDCYEVNGDPVCFPNL